MNTTPNSIEIPFNKLILWDGSGFRVDISRGQRIGRVSSEWFARTDDE